MKVFDVNTNAKQLLDKGLRISDLKEVCKHIEPRNHKCLISSSTKPNWVSHVHSRLEQLFGLADEAAYASAMSLIAFLSIDAYACTQYMRADDRTCAIPTDTDWRQALPTNYKLSARCRRHAETSGAPVDSLHSSQNSPDTPTEPVVEPAVEQELLAAPTATRALTPLPPPTLTQQEDLRRFLTQMPTMGQEFKKRILDDVVKPLCGPTLCPRIRTDESADRRLHFTVSDHMWRMLRHGDKPEIDRATGLRLQYNLHLYMYPAAAAEAYMSQSGDAQPIELEYPENLIVLSYPNYEHIVRTTGIFRRKLLPLDKLITNQNERDYTLDLQFEGSQDMVASVIAVGCPSVKDVLMAVRDKNRIDAEQSPAMLMTATSGGHRENEADDEDVQCTSQSLSLNCPLSMTRMVLPVRTQHCKHAECFDAKSFIKSYENSMTWSCPHCPSDTDNVIASWKDLYVDGFMLSMLEKYADDVRALSFVIEDNAWHPVSDTRDVAFDMLLERRPEDGDIFDGYFDDADDNDDDDTCVIADDDSDDDGAVRGNNQAGIGRASSSGGDSSSTIVEIIGEDRNGDSNELEVTQPEVSRPLSATNDDAHTTLQDLALSYDLSSLRIVDSTGSLCAIDRSGTFSACVSSQSPSGSAQRVTTTFQIIVEEVVNSGN